MRILGPTDLLAAAAAVRHGVNEGTEQLRDLVDLVPRLVAMVDRGEALLTRAETLLTRAERAAVRAEEVAEAADATRRRTDEVVARSEGLLARTEALLEPVERLAPQAMPVVEAVVGSISESETKAMTEVLDLLPGLVTELQGTGTNVSDILDAVQDLSHAMQGLPGMGLMKRRGERKDTEEDALDAAGDHDA